MEVSFNLRNVSAASSSHPARPTSGASAAHDEVVLENARALTKNLHDTPAVRDDVVRRATELVGRPDYPPPETIRKISHLLAIQVHPED